MVFDCVENTAGFMPRGFVVFLVRIVCFVCAISSCFNQKMIIYLILFGIKNNKWNCSENDLVCCMVRSWLVFWQRLCIVMLFASVKTEWHMRCVSVSVCMQPLQSAANTRTLISVEALLCVMFLKSEWDRNIQLLTFREQTC